MPTGRAWTTAVNAHWWHGLTTEECEDPGWNRATGANWAPFFADHHAIDIPRYEGQGERPPPGRFNIDGRRRFWSGRSVAAVLAPIAAGDHPRLETPPAPPAIGGHALVRWLRRIKEEPGASSRRRGREPPHGHLRLVRPKREPQWAPAPEYERRALEVRQDGDPEDFSG
ncbi:uncharacterized protein LOC112271554 [Brachypodium distachyon]|uniref:uncharacterized protein LOC112271554 n=1 Tax=Brachypodium distachyon TaxID=15368 RepID=UPI000D0D7F65|nr:uncharacterized protein LOC112271554 [Brachypodium distachyon]|eukprot:XP_024316655.1 uncharacterized protein LOC112271554 [Brachypodium distachyon]